MKAQHIFSDPRRCFMHGLKSGRPHTATSERVLCLKIKEAAMPVSMRLCSTLYGQVGRGEVIHIGTTFPGYNASTGAGFKEPELERASEPVRVMTKDYQQKNNENSSKEHPNRFMFYSHASPVAPLSLSGGGKLVMSARGHAIHRMRLLTKHGAANYSSPHNKKIGRVSCGLSNVHRMSFHAGFYWLWPEPRRKY